MTLRLCDLAPCALAPPIRRWRGTHTAPWTGSSSRKGARPQPAVFTGRSVRADPHLPCSPLRQAPAVVGRDRIPPSRPRFAASPQRHLAGARPPSAASSPSRLASFISELASSEVPGFGAPALRQLSASKPTPPLSRSRGTTASPHPVGGGDPVSAATAARWRTKCRDVAVSTHTRAMERLGSCRLGQGSLRGLIGECRSGRFGCRRIEPPTKCRPGCLGTACTRPERGLPSSNGRLGDGRGTAVANTKRWIIFSTVVLGLLVGWQIAAFAANAKSSIVKYWGPAQGNNWCGKVQAEIDDQPSYQGSAISWSLAYYGANCLNTHSVSAGYLGAQVHLVRSNGNLCGSTPWSFNASSAQSHASAKNLNPSGSCPANGTYRSSAHAEHWNPNTNQYVQSNWVNSPYIPFS